MKISVDARPLLSRRTGIGQYTYHLLREFAKQDQQNEYYLCGAVRRMENTRLSVAKDMGTLDGLLHKITTNFKVPFPFKKLVRVANEWTMLKAMKRLGVHLFWGTCYFGVDSPVVKNVITIHDMAHEVYPQYIHPAMAKDLRRKLRRHAARADGIIAVSQNTKKDIVRYLGLPEEKIRVVHNGVAEQFCPMSKESLRPIRKKYGLHDPFILFVGMLEPRKNIVGLLRAFGQLAQDAGFRHRLVIAGSKGWQYAEIFRTVKELGLGPRVFFSGYVPDEELPGLYNLADLFVYPSFYEGFGIPVLEAMACGTPVVTSNVSSLPEVGGQAVRYVDPTDTKEMMKAIAQVLHEEDLRKEMRAKGLARAQSFTWERAARQHLQVFADVAGRGAIH